MFAFSHGQREHYLSPSNHAMFYFLYINNIFDHLITIINIIIWIFITMFEDCMVRNSQPVLPANVGFKG